MSITASSKVCSVVRKDILLKIECIAFSCSNAIWFGEGVSKCVRGLFFFFFKF